MIFKHKKQIKLQHTSGVAKSTTTVEPLSSWISDISQSTEKQTRYSMGLNGRPICVQTYTIQKDIVFLYKRRRCWWNKSHNGNWCTWTMSLQIKTDKLKRPLEISCILNGHYEAEEAAFKGQQLIFYLNSRYMTSLF